MNWKKIVLFLVIGLLVVYITIAGQQPEGKPFQQLWNAILGLQDQDAALQQQINDLEARVVALEGQQIPDGVLCDDGNACTTGDVYTDGVCIGIALNCDDGDECTIDTCDSLIGCVYYTNPDCNDFDVDGYRIIDGDCEDGNANIHPGAVEICNGVDDDCDIEIDEDCTSCVIDGVMNGDEIDIDCGGSCPPCDTGQNCNIGDDCLSGVCSGGICQAPTCDDNTDCPIGEYCHKGVGDCDGEGECELKPSLCPLHWAPVCGCDGNTYNNVCYVALAGVNVNYEGECV